MSAAKRRARSTKRARVKPLPIQALYYVSQLARATGVTHRRIQRLLSTEGVRVYQLGRDVIVPLTELEEKVPHLWESVRAVQSLRAGLDDE